MSRSKDSKPLNLNGRIDYDKTKMHFYVNIKAFLMTYRHTTRMKVNN